MPTVRFALAGRARSDHLFLVDRDGTRYIDCSDVSLPFASQLCADVTHRTSTAMPHMRVVKPLLEHARAAIPSSGAAKTG